MMPESAVCSPTAFTRTRRLPPSATIPAITAAPGAFEITLDSPVITGSVEVARIVHSFLRDQDTSLVTANRRELRETSVSCTDFPGSIHCFLWHKRSYLWDRNSSCLIGTTCDDMDPLSPL